MHSGGISFRSTVEFIPQEPCILPDKILRFSETKGAVFDVEKGTLRPPRRVDWQLGDKIDTANHGRGSEEIYIGRFNEYRSDC
jgi:hypothetical protein